MEHKTELSPWSDLLLEIPKAESQNTQLETIRSASECSLESECSDSDTGYKAGGSDTESDVEMEVRESFLEDDATFCF